MVQDFAQKLTCKPILTKRFVQNTALTTRNGPNRGGDLPFCSFGAIEPRLHCARSLLIDGDAQQLAVLIYSPVARVAVRFNGDHGQPPLHRRCRGSSVRGGVPHMLRPFRSSRRSRVGRSTKVSRTAIAATADGSRILPSSETARLVFDRGPSQAVRTNCRDELPAFLIRPLI